MLWIISFGYIHNTCIHNTYTLTSSWCLNKLMLLKKLIECIFCSHWIFREYCVGHPIYISSKIYIYIILLPYDIPMWSNWGVENCCLFHAGSQKHPQHAILLWVLEPKQHQFKANVLSWLSIGGRREGWGVYHYKWMLNSYQRPVISHSPARTKVTQFLAIYN